MKKIVYTLILTLITIPLIMGCGEEEGTIIGTVQDKDGRGIGGATITTEPPTHEASTRGDGNYVILGVSGGIYKVKVTKGGKTLGEKSVEVEGGKEVRVDFSVEGVILSVSGDQPIVDFLSEFSIPSHYSSQVSEITYSFGRVSGYLETITCSKGSITRKISQITYDPFGRMRGFTEVRKYNPGGEHTIKVSLIEYNPYSQIIGYIAEVDGRYYFYY